MCVCVSVSVHVHIYRQSNNACGFEMCIDCVCFLSPCLVVVVVVVFLPRMRSCPEGNLSLIGRLWQPLL